MLHTFNNNNPNDKYVISCVLRDEKVIKVDISKNFNNLTILDSYAMLPETLAKLGDNFNVVTLKSKFP